MNNGYHVAARCDEGFGQFYVHFSVLYAMYKITKMVSFQRWTFISIYKHFKPNTIKTRGIVEEIGKMFACHFCIRLDLLNHKLPVKEPFVHNSFC